MKIDEIIEDLKKIENIPADFNPSNKTLVGEVYNISSNYDTTKCLEVFSHRAKISELNKSRLLTHIANITHNLNCTDSILCSSVEKLSKIPNLGLRGLHDLLNFLKDIQENSEIYADFIITSENHQTSEEAPNHSIFKKIFEQEFLVFQIGSTKECVRTSEISSVGFDLNSHRITKVTLKSGVIIY